MATIKRDSMEATSELSAQLKSTTLSTPTSTPSAKPPRSHLTTLPPPILNTIFSHLLDTELVNANISNVSYTHTLQPSGTLQFQASRPPFPVHTALFRVSKKLSEAARAYFYAQNLFIRFTFRTPDARHAKTMLADSGVLFSVAGFSALEASTSHAMDLVLVEKDSTQKRAVVMFPAQYLPRLVNFMDQASKATTSWASGHKLEMSVRNTYAFPISRLQGDLLEPFRFLSSFSSVAISPANLLPGYAEGLQTSMTTAFTPASWLTTVSALADRAEEAAAGKEDGEVGRQLYNAAIIAQTYAYLTHPEDLHSQPEAFAKGVQRLRWRCELGVGNSILAQHGHDKPHTHTHTHTETQPSLTPALARDLLTAETALSAALSLATNSPSPTSNPWLATLPVDLVPPNAEAWFADAERGVCWWRLGLAHAALGEFLFAAGDLERAVEMLGGGDAERTGEVEGLFEWVRGSIDWERRPGEGLRRAAVLARRV
ncbi:hypothetical protein K505DRAFT_121838 [Melanomma pulvis-pyrius CBS 109.77]|uniref:Uncharacterized protein n=1 Tax=Melanomma pulvis-pyrius CBS 109.77 TaxID=1314802 RepID=A0A6A6WV51_9PLEO|nr:hypothetical protein K505DRAFT_121838 [Melanomma pulvis-pyrius CBS 109.77]